MVTNVKTKLVNNTQDIIFRRIHGNRLIYNACWEDPRIDRQLLQLDRQSKVVMITSAGCNALDYLLDSPARIDSIDVNPRQNALLHLKLSLIRAGDFKQLFAMFGLGSHPDYEAIYAAVRPELPAYAQEFWDKKIYYFAPDNSKKSFYFHGTAGDVAWLFRHFLKTNKDIRRGLHKLLEAGSLSEQKEIYARLEAHLWNRFVCWSLKHPMLLAMVGVPRPQVQLIKRQYPGGVIGYIRDNFKQICTEISLRDNYFWRVYLTGSYTRTCCPNYLKKENFALLRDNLNHIHTYNTTLTEFLKCHPGPYSHFILLDHQDWLAWHDPRGLEQEWQYILNNSRPGSKILMRSAGPDVSFIPKIAKNSLRFSPKLTAPLHRQDRVGTYGSFHFAEVIV